MSSRENYKRFLNAIGTNSVKKRSPSLPIFSSISPKSFSKTFCKASKSFVSQRLTIPLTRNRLLARGTSFPLDPLSAKGILRKFAIAHKLVCQWRTCTLGLQLSLRSNADPSVTFGTSFASPKRRENEPFSLTVRQAPQALPIPFFLDCVTNNTLSDTTQSSLLSIILPNQNATKKSSQNTKKAGYLSLLLLPSFCVSLHFDLLFCKPDFETHQPYEQSH